MTDSQDEHDDDCMFPIVSGWEQHEAMEREWERQRIEDEIEREQRLEEWAHEVSATPWN